MKPLFASALLFLALAPTLCRAAGTEATPSALTYTLEPVVSGNALRLGVDLLFAGDTTGRTRLHLPNHFAGQGELYRNIQELKAVSPEVTLAETEMPDIKQVTFPPGQTVHLHYWVAMNDVGRPGQPGIYFRPTLQPGWFSLIGTTFWIYPAQYGQQLSATLHWKMPTGWTLCDSLGTGQADQQFQGTLEQFLETVYSGGDFRVQTVTIGGRPVTIALRGKWKFSDADFATVAARILQTERDFWQDADFPYYLVLLVPTEQTSSTSTEEGGVELTHTVALFQPKGKTLDFGLTHVLAHEAFHTWNADQMCAGDMSLLWFSEGFTEYYSRLLLLRAGLISLDEYVRDCNRVLGEYLLSPALGSRADAAGRSFYAGDALAKLPYQQGAILAAHWNAALRQATGDKVQLDDVMRDLRRAALATGQPVTGEQVADAIRHYAPIDAADDIRQAVTEGGTLQPDPHALGPGFTLRTVRLAPFELGFDAGETASRRIMSGVKTGSHAYWAGLRDGQEVLACEPFTMGDPNQRLSLTVRDSAGTQNIEFTPAGDPKPIPQYVRDKSAADDPSCRAWFGNPSTPVGH